MSHPEPLPGANPLLCSNCQAWDNPHNVFRQQIPHSGKDINAAPLETLAQHRDCLLCQFVCSAIEEARTVKPDEFDRLDEIVSVGPGFIVQYDDPSNPDNINKSFYRPPVGENGDPLKCVLKLHIHGHHAPESVIDPRRRQPRLTLEVQALLFYDWPGIHLTDIRRWETPTFDVQLVKNWITHCHSEHGDHCKKLPVTPPEEFKLIDVENLCIIEASESVRYIALSYVWGSSSTGRDLQLVRSNLTQLQRCRGLDKSALPDVIVDAMTLCTDLGERYLWVDRLCIIQDDPMSKHGQILNMDLIYGMAAFTIVCALEGSDVPGIPGVNTRPRRSSLHSRKWSYHSDGYTVEPDFYDVVNRSIWNTRGWTFQERLMSPRCLYITEYQVYFNCPQLLFQEDLGGISYSRATNSVQSPLVNVWDATMRKHYFDYVMDYTSREFSYESDVLNAFTGVSNVLASHMQTDFYFGLPEKHLLRAMLWEHIEHRQRRQGAPPEIPSWSWATWSGPITFKLAELVKEYGALVQFHIADPQQGIRLLDMEENWFGYTENEKSRTVGRMPRYGIMPSQHNSEILWQSCPHNPWNAPNHTALNAEASVLARKYPGCLIFNTTVAHLFIKRCENSSNRDQMVTLDLCDDKFRDIGHIRLSDQWVNKNIDLQRPKRFVAIVLCASLLRKYRRRGILRRRPAGCDLGKNVWKLCVMLVRQRRTCLDSLLISFSGRHCLVAERIGIGFVDVGLWRLVEPKWKTAILV